MRVAVDIGGTFTDVTAFDERDGSIKLGKALTTPGQLVTGVMRAITRTGTPLSEVDLIIHGSTLVINAILERHGAKTALVTTQGFRDVYEIGRINRPDSYNLFFKKHRPLIPRDLVFEVPERMLADGREDLPLDEAAAREVARELRERDVEAVAILFLHSYNTPEHEIRMKEILAEACPGLFVTASHELSREYREYERTSTVAANAFVGPIVSTYLGELERRLHDDRFGGALMIMQSSGGLSDVEVARRQCIQMMESGPAGGVVGAVAISQQLGLDQSIAFDLGGTTAKACVIRQGRPELAADYFVGGYNDGLAIRIPVLEIKEVGTGGGSLAWIDEGGALHVGPKSAGADPGPACYGRGGTQPTITDADVALGRISTERFLGGDMPLDHAAAVRAIRDRVAEPLGLTFERAASGILAIGVASMAYSVRAVTAERGLDPRDFTLIAYGGGGPLHALEVADELSIRKVVIPQAPAHFSAFGMLTADLRRDFVQTHISRLATVPLEEIEAIYGALEEQGRQSLEGLNPGAVVFERSADMRYVGQEHTVTIPVPARIGDEAARATIKRTLDEVHEQRFSHSAPDEAAEIVSLRVSVIGQLNKPAVPVLARGGTAPPDEARRPSRMVTFGDSKATLCQVFDRDRLLAGNIVEGPAVVEEAASSTLLRAGALLEVSDHGHLLIRLEAP